jgi:hypothetical protein
VVSLIEDPDGTLRALVDNLGYDLEPSILIGGWASYLRVGGPMSHDIDLIIGDDAVRQKLEARLDELNRTTHLSEKWSGEVEGVHMDIYLPYKSELGTRLRLRVEVLRAYAEPAEDPTQRWLLLNAEAHVISKMAALLDRSTTSKGVKDANEIIAFLRKSVDAQTAVEVLVEATAGPIEDVPSHIDDAFRYLAERGDTNRDDRKWLDGLRRDWLDQATIILRRRTGDVNARPSIR